MPLMLRLLCKKSTKCTNNGNFMFVLLHVSSVKLINGFLLNFVLKVYSEICCTYVVLIHIDPIHHLYITFKEDFVKFLK